MDVFLLDEDNVILAPWLYVHSLHTRIPKSKTQLTFVHLLNMDDDDGNGDGNYPSISDINNYSEL